MPNREAKELIEGLTAIQKHISSKYFYDDKGSELFQKITETPEYYLTSCEKEILYNHAKGILDHMGKNPFNIVELGAGDGSKAAIFLEKALHSENFLDYYAVDISPKALDSLSQHLKSLFPGMEPQTIIADYYQNFAAIKLPQEANSIFLFLGSSIGNFSPDSAKKLLEKMALRMKDGDLLVIGFDLKKDERILYKAYNDSQGLTADFNLNLLERLNRDYGANFDLEKFKHIEIYNPGLGAMESYLLSMEKQKVFVEDLELEVTFQENELLHTENSYKYTEEEIKELIKDTGLRSQIFYFDKKRYFTTALFLGPHLH